MIVGLGLGITASGFVVPAGGRTAIPVTVFGDAQVDTAQSKFGGASLYINGTGDYLEVDLTTLAVGTGDITWETWVYLIDRDNNFTPFDARPGTNGFYPALFTGGSGQGPFLWWNGARRLTHQTLSTTAVWQHYALVRQSGVWTVYLDGVASTSTYTAADSITMTDARIGVNFNLGTQSEGYIDEMRISNIARYTTGFTPSTTPFVNDENTLLLLHMDGTDGSTVFNDDNTIGYESDTVEFDGTNDYYEVTGLTTTATDSKFLTMAFTWFHPTGGNSRNQHFMTARLGTSNGENGWEVCLQSGRIRYQSYDNSGSNTDGIYGDGLFTVQNAWNQMVIYIDHNNKANCKWFVNGIDRSGSLVDTSVGFLALSNNNINWGSSNVSIKIGEEINDAVYRSNFVDFLGKISQIYVHNASGAPDISKFWQDGRPLDLGTQGTTTGLARPLIYHYGGTSTFATNNGDGFNNYTLTANGNIVTSTDDEIYRTS